MDHRVTRYASNYIMPSMKYFQDVHIPDILQANERSVRTELIKAFDLIINQKTICKNKDHWIESKAVWVLHADNII